MAYILLGLCAYLALALFEWASLRGMAALKVIMAVLVLLISVVSHTAIGLSPRKFTLSSGLSVLGWAMAVMFACLWLYSMFGEIPFAKTYLGAGHGDRLVTTGTYALCRHPTVLWYGMILCGLLLATRSIDLLVAAPIWLAADALYVWAEEKLFLRRMFADYEQYQRQTPMLLPTGGSVRCWLRTMNNQQRRTGGVG